MTDRLTRYMPLIAACAVSLIVVLAGMINYWRKGGQVETRDPIIILATAVSAPTVVPQTIGYFDLYDDSTAIAIDPHDIIGAIAYAEPDWTLVLLRGGGRVWMSGQAVPYDLSYRPPTATPMPPELPHERQQEAPQVVVVYQPVPDQPAQEQSTQEQSAPIENPWKGVDWSCPGALPCPPPMQDGESLGDYAHRYDEQIHTVKGAP